jgi:cytochrome c-type biogenesis protein CcmF
MGGAWAYESLSFGGFWAWDPVENASLVPWIFLVAAGHLMLVNKDKERSIYSTLLLTMLSFIFILYSTFLTRSGVLGETSVHSFTGDGLLGQLLAYQLFFVWMMIVLLLVGKKTRLMFTLFCAVLVVLGFVVDIHAQLYVSGEFILTWKGLIILVFFTGAMIFMINNYLLQFPREKKEEELWSREFWIFIASIVLSLSAIQITIDTSIPVINSLFDSDMQLIEQAERNAHYNNWQAPFSIIILFLLALTQFLKYQNTDFKQWSKAILRPLLLAFGLTLISAFLLPLTHPNYYILLFTCYFALTANADYWLLILKGKKNHAGQAIAHIGFALIILGALISQNRQEIISATYDGEDIRGYSGDQKNPMDNRIDAQIFRNDTSEMKEYFIAYRDKSLDEHFLRFHIDYFSKVPSVFKKGDKVRFMGELYEAKSNHESDTSRTLNPSLWTKIDSADLKTYYGSPNWSPFQVGEKVFELTPFVQLNDMTNVAEPGTKHFFDHDVFTHIKYADLRPINDAKEMPPFRMTGKLGATIAAPGFVVTLKELKGLPDTLNEKYGYEKTDIVGALSLRFFDRLDVQGKYPVDVNHFFKIEENNVVSEFQDVPYFNVKINLDSIRPVQKQHVHDANDSAHLAQHAMEDSLAAIGKTMSDTAKMEFNMSETELVISFKTPEFIVMHAIRFPWISILWIGSLVMVLGTALAIRHRIQLNRKLKSQA